MKRFFFTLLSFFGVSTSSFAMDQHPNDIDRPLHYNARISSCKDLTPGPGDPRYNDPRYYGRQAMSNADYPPMVINHSYNHQPVETPLSAALGKAFPSFQLSKIHAQHRAEGREIHYAVVSQTLEPLLPDGSVPSYTLKPQYAIHAGYPAIYDGHVFTGVQPLMWTVVPGTEGRIVPALGEFQDVGLLKDSVVSHPAGLPMVKKYPVIHMNAIPSLEPAAERERIIASIQGKGLIPDENGMFNMDDVNGIPMEQRISTRANALGLEADINGDVNMDDIEGVHPSMRMDPNYMILSGDSIHIKGAHPDKSANCTSVFEYEDQEGKKIALYTLHEFLTQEQRPIFQGALQRAHTIRELMRNLLPYPAFKPFLTELAQFVGLTPRIEQIDITPQPTGLAAKIEPLSEEFTVTTDYNASASYQLVSNRFAVATGQKISVPYNITVEKGSRISLGLLNTNGDSWYGEELVLEPGIHQDVYETVVPANETTAALVLRNYHLGAPGQSTFTVNATVKVDNQPVVAQLTPTTSPSSVLRKGAVRVTTDNNANASYQLQTPSFPVEAGEEISVSYDVEVEKGGILSLGLLNTSRDGWYGEELILKAGPHQGVFKMLVPLGETETSLVFRNYHLGTPGQTIFTLKDLKIEKKGKPQ